MSETGQIRRRLAAIAFADVAGWSRLVEKNDIGTLLSWKTMRGELIEPKVREHAGRLLEVAGDSVLVEFPSVVSAVNWAVDTQRALASRVATHESPELTLRIGINVEDVIVDDEKLIGDGVNIASRIHQLAAPGEIIVTAAVREYVLNKLPVLFTDLGNRELKNITRRVHLYRVEGQGGKPIAARAQAAWSDRPSIAVLPFRDLGGDPAQSYFGEGITEDIIGGLARNRSLLVIARHSTLPYRDRTTDIAQIAQELGVRYVVGGSVRRQASRLRISADLIDATQNRTLWAERFDGDNEDVFAFQDQIASRIVSTLEPRLYEAEAARARSKPTESLDAYECLLKAFPKFYTLAPDDFDEAGRYLERAVALDPSYAQAHAYKAWWHVLRCGERRSQVDIADVELAENAARLAVSLDPQDALALAVAAHAESFLRKRPERASEMFEHALKINVNCAFAWGMSAITCCYLGQPDEAHERLAKFWRLSPFDPLNYFFWGVAGLADLIAGRYEQALTLLEKGRHGNPGSVACQRHYTACLGLMDRVEEAKAAAQELLNREPGFRVSKFAAEYILRGPGDLDRVVRGLRVAGLPE
jgi:adenylate cyclase